MTFTPGLVAVLGALTVFIALYAIFTPIVKTKRDSIKDEFFGSTEASDQIDATLGKYAKPLLNNFLPQLPLGQMAPKRRNDIADLLIKSGNPWKLTPEEYVGVQIVFSAIGFFVGLVLGVLGLIPVVPPYLIVIGFTAIGFFLPISVHRTRRDSRVKDIQKQLPEALDLLVVTLTSGQPFEPALAQVVPQLLPGLLRDQLLTINLKIRAGNTLERALLDFSREIASEEVESFTKAIVQAQKLGADITETLAQQATFVRNNHEARVQRMIARLETIMFIPLAATMLPAFLIIFLAPSISSLTHML